MQDEYVPFKLIADYWNRSKNFGPIKVNMHADD